MRRRWLNLRKGLLRLILPLLRALPPRDASRLVAWIGRTEYARVRGVRLRVDAAVARGRNHFGCAWDVEAVGSDLAGNHVRARTRDLLLDGLSDRRVAPLFVVRGVAALDAARGEGGGVILLGNHFGANTMPAHWLIRRGDPVRLFMERPRHVSRLLGRQFASRGPLGQDKLFVSRRTSPNEAAVAILRAARILQAGMILNIAGDIRWSGPQTCRARFLGRSYTFSATWAVLAALTGAPVVPVFCRMARDGTYHLEFLPAFHVPEAVRDPSQAFPWVQNSLRLIEERVLQFPCNSNEYLFWSEDDADREVTRCVRGS